MKKLLLSALIVGISSNVFASTAFEFKTKKFDYQVPQRIVKACAKKIARDEDPKTTCMNVDVDLSVSNIAWINDELNSEFDDEFKAELNEAAKSVYENLMEKDSYVNQYDYTSKLILIGKGNRLVQIISDDYEYSGGAHGTLSAGFFVFDTKEQKTLEFYDILIDDKQPQFEKLALSAYKVALRQKYKYQDQDEKLDEKEWQEHLESYPLIMSENFYFTPTHLVLSYNPYQLGPYAMGFIELKIDKKSLKGIIKDVYLNEKFVEFNQDYLE